MKDQKRKLKIAVISGASNAVKYLEKNSRATESEVLKHITREMNNIIRKIDED